MKTKTVVMDPFDICHVAQRANKIDTHMLIIQMVCNARQMLAS